MKKIKKKRTPRQNNTTTQYSRADETNHQPTAEFCKQVLESISDYAVFTITSKGIISSWNAGAERLLGYLEAEIIGQSAAVLFVEEDIKKKVPAKEMKEALANGRAIDDRYHRRKDGSTFYVSGLVFPLYNKGGKHIGFTKVMRDRTALKRAVEEMEEAKQYAESIVETAREPLVVLHEDLTINTANRTFYQTFKLKPSATANKLIYNIGKEEWNIPRLKELLENIVPGNHSFNDFEVTQNFPRIGKKTLLLSARTLYRPGNHTKMILLAIEDITSRKAAELDKHAFIGIASHELKTPVASIKGMAAVLKDKIAVVNDPSLQKPVRRIAELSDKLYALINNLLDVSAIQSGKLSLNREIFCVNDLIADTIQDFQHSSTKHRMLFNPKHQYMVYADKFRIGQVINNLISNAIKYSPDESKITVQLRKGRSNSLVTVCIKDFGMGIPKEDQHDLFEKFTRAKSHRQQNIPGFGLGLHIVSQIVQQHEGKLTLTSAENKGATFCFTVPAA